jgi:hypothetical protein
MVTSRLPDSTPPAPAVADGFPAGRDGLADVDAGGAVGSGAVVAVGVTASEGVADPDGVAVADPSAAGVPPSPQATNAPEHASTATPVTHFSFDIPCSSTGDPARARGVHCAPPGRWTRHSIELDAGDPPAVSPYPGEPESICAAAYRGRRPAGTGSGGGVHSDPGHVTAVFSIDGDPCQMADQYERHDRPLSSNRGRVRVR